MRLRLAAAGIAIGEYANNAREIGGNNRGEFVRKYLKSAGFGEGAPWCAAFTYWCIEEAAQFLNCKNPFQGMKYPALVSAYATMARDNGWLMPPERAREGDLVVFHWPSGNHIGFLLDRPPVLAGRSDVVGPFWTIEGNTGPGVGFSAEEMEREGDGVYRKLRKYDAKQVRFIRWDGGQIGPRRLSLDDGLAKAA